VAKIDILVGGSQASDRSRGRLRGRADRSNCLRASGTWNMEHGAADSLSASFATPIDEEYGAEIAVLCSIGHRPFRQAIWRLRLLERMKNI
jgi:hypothetical protein